MAEPKIWKITVVGGEGDTATVEINRDARLHDLLKKGLHALYGDNH